jgi:hypothetical protein
MKNPVVYLAMCLALAAVMWAQSSSSSATTQSGNSENQMQQSQSSGNNQQETIEGCIVKRETAFYIQPTSGAPATQLNAGGQNLSSHVGQQVRISGTRENNTNTSQTASGSQTSTGMSNSSAAGDLLVSRVDVVAATCPADTQGRHGGMQQQNPPQ